MILTGRLCRQTYLVFNRRLTSTLFSPQSTTSTSSTSSATTPTKAYPNSIYLKALGKCQSDKDTILATELMQKLLSSSGVAKNHGISRIVTEYLYTIDCLSEQNESGVDGGPEHVDTQWMQSAIDESVISAFEYLYFRLNGHEVSSSSSSSSSSHGRRETVEFENESWILYLKRLISSGYRRDACELLKKRLAIADNVKDERYHSLVVDLLVKDANINGLRRLSKLSHLKSQIVSGLSLLGCRNEAFDLIIHSDTPIDNDSICSLAKLSSSLSHLDLKMTNDCFELIMKSPGKPSPSTFLNITTSRIAAKVETLGFLIRDQVLLDRKPVYLNEDLHETALAFLDQFKSSIILDFEQLKATGLVSRRLFMTMIRFASYCHWIQPEAYSHTAINQYLHDAISHNIYPDTQMLNDAMLGHAGLPLFMNTAGSQEVKELATSKIQRTMKIFGMMRKLNIQPDAGTVRALILSCHKGIYYRDNHYHVSRNLQQPIGQLIHWSIQSGIQPDKAGYAQIMATYALYKSSDEYMKYLDWALRKDQSLLSPHTFLPYFRQAIHNADMAPKAIFIFKSIEEDSPHLLEDDTIFNAECYRLLIECCALVESEREALKIFESAKRNLTNLEDVASVMNQLCIVADNLPQTVSEQDANDSTLEAEEIEEELNDIDLMVEKQRENERKRRLTRQELLQYLDKESKSLWETYQKQSDGPELEELK